MSTIEEILTAVDSLNADEIRNRLAALAAEDKALRSLLRTKIQAQRERQKLAPKPAGSCQEAVA